jgi:uncharacterized protein involved in exopolysaccharide biosynthesis
LRKELFMSRIRMRTKPTAFPAARRTDDATAPRSTWTLRRSLGWIVVPTGLAALGSGAYVTMVPPQYTGEAQLVLEARGGPEAAPATALDGRAVAGQVQAMMSRDIAREAIKRLKLVGNPEFDPTAGEIGPVRQAMMVLGIGANPLDRPTEDQVIENYFDRLHVRAIEASPVVTIEFRSQDPKLAAEAANTVAQLSIAALAAGRGDTARPAATALGETVTALRRRVAEADAKVEAYRARNSLVGAAGGPGQPLNAQQLSDLSNQLSQARIQRADVAGRVAAIKELIKDGRSIEITDVANNEVLRRLVDSRISVRAQLAMESRTLLPAHPRIKALKAQLEDVDAQIKTAAERALHNLETDAKNADGRIAGLQTAIDGQQAVVKVSANETELRALEREAKGQRDQLDAALGRLREASAVSGTTPTEARLLAKAETPTAPSFPDELAIVSTATLATFLLSLFGVLSRVLRSRSARKRAVLAQKVRAPAPDMAAQDRAAVVVPDFMVAERWAEPVTAAGPAEAKPVTAEVVAPLVAAVQMPEPAPIPAVAQAPEAAASPVAEPITETVADLAEAPRDTVAETPPSAFDLSPLMARLSQRPVMAFAPTGRMIVLMESEPLASAGLPAALAGAFGRTGSVLMVDLGGDSAGETGFTDVVAGEAAFEEAIRADGPGGAHRVAAGLTETGVLFDDPAAVAFTLEAMAEVYEWVVCRLRQGEEATELLALVSTLADSVIIASNADPSDETLADLYAVASDAGAGQVLIAQDRPVAEAAPALDGKTAEPGRIAA